MSTKTSLMITLPVGLGATVQHCELAVRTSRSVYRVTSDVKIRKQEIGKQNTSL